MVNIVEVGIFGFMPFFFFFFYLQSIFLVKARRADDRFPLAHAYRQGNANKRGRSHMTARRILIYDTVTNQNTGYKSYETGLSY